MWNTYEVLGVPGWIAWNSRLQQAMAILKWQRTTSQGKHFILPYFNIFRVEHQDLLFTIWTPGEAADWSLPTVCGFTVPGDERWYGKDDIFKRLRSITQSAEILDFRKQQHKNQQYLRGRCSLLGKFFYSKVGNTYFKRNMYEFTNKTLQE